MPEVQHSLVQTVRLQMQERAERHEKEAKTIIDEMSLVRENISTGVTKLVELSQRLRTHALRERDEMTQGYIAYSNAYARICGALNQGLRRTASMGRVLDSAKANQEEAKQRETKEEARGKLRAQNREIEKLSLPTSDDFALVYGEDSE